MHFNPEIQSAWEEGYRAGWQFHMGSKYHAENPYDRETDVFRWRAWDCGFADAGEDS